MMAKRVKGKNFTSEEICTLIDLVESSIGVIENKNTDGVTVKQKNKAWEDVTNSYNAINKITRTTAQLKTCYDNYKRKLKKDNADDKVCTIYHILICVVEVNVLIIIG